MVPNWRPYVLYFFHELFHILIFVVYCHSTKLDSELVPIVVENFSLRRGGLNFLNKHLFDIFTLLVHFFNSAIEIFNVLFPMVVTQEAL